MHGYQLTFFTQQDRKHHGLLLAQWLPEGARIIGISGATLIQAAEGSAHFLELAEQQEVTMAGCEADATRLFAWLKEEGNIEFGMTGDLPC